MNYYEQRMKNNGDVLATNLDMLVSTLNIRERHKLEQMISEQFGAKFTDICGKNVYLVYDKPEEAKLPESDLVNVIRCKNCRHFEYDHLVNIDGMPLIVNQVCTKHGGGIQVSENEYCSLAEPKESVNRV